MAPREPKNQMSSFPRNVSFAKDGNTVQYRQQLTRACVQSKQLDAMSDETLTVVADIDEKRVIIESTAGEVDDLIRSGRAMPAYSYEGGPVSFVPTGRVFLRVDRDSRVVDYKTELRKAGFAITEPHPRFDFAAWLTAASEQTGEALRLCKALGEIAGVENAEPEMLSASARR